MSIDSKIPAEAKAIREKVRKWVQEECIPAEKELDTKPLDDVLGKLRIEARAKACGARSCRRNMAAWAWVRSPTRWCRGTRRKHPGRAVHEHAGARRCLDADDPDAWHGISEEKVPLSRC